MGIQVQVAKDFRTPVPTVLSYSCRVAVQLFVGSLFEAGQVGGIGVEVGGEGKGSFWP